MLTLDPLNARAFRAAGFIALFADDWPRVIETMEKALELNPNLASAHYAIGNARLMLGDAAGAKVAFAAEPAAIFSQTGLAICEARLGNREAAQTAFDALVAEFGDSSLYQQTQVLAQFGEIDSAIAMLTRAYEAGDPGVLLAANDPLLDPLREASAFQQLLLERAT